MNIGSLIREEAIVAGLGGLGAAAAIFSSATLRPENQIREENNVSTELANDALEMESLFKEIQGLEEAEIQDVWAQEYHQSDVNSQETNANAWGKEFLPIGDVNLLEESRWISQFKSSAHQLNQQETGMSGKELIDSVEKIESKQEGIADTMANDLYDYEYKIKELDWAQSQESGARKEEFWRVLEEEWGRLAEDESQTHPWLSQSNTTLNQDYKFLEENVFRGLSNPLTEGKRRLNLGDIPNAVLAFESAVQKDPKDAEAWVLLGRAQAQNEQDPVAISAFNQALRIEPGRLSALLALAASLTNEAFELQAAQALKNWLRENPKYSHLIPQETGKPQLRVSSILTREELDGIQNAFIQAARLNPRGSLDPDVQSALGILFNLGKEYEKAADCFTAAISLRPNDSLLWNRLGATLANGGKSAEAVSAYRRALELSPHFIRTRYNLGVTCINLNSYREAAEHFLTALNEQSIGGKESLMSPSIWNSLRIILHLLNREDLISALDLRDLTKLNKAFNITS